MGINLYPSCNNNTLFQNIANDNTGIGIRIYNCDNNTIVNNTANGNQNYGIMIGVSQDNSISENICNANKGSYGFGIFVLAGRNNSVFKNIINDNTRGIEIKNGAHDCEILENIITDNDEYGIIVYNDTPAICFDNLLYKNTFKNPSAINAYDNGTNTQWDNNKTGNYWHDYDGKDRDDDGIGDSPYTKIGGMPGAVDDYPIWDDGCDVDCSDAEEDDGEWDITINPIALGIVVGTFAGIFVFALILKIKK